ncbi:MAG: FecR domain-containing protein [Bryobacteraceae bacterium]|jgi:hypothetical protein
MRCLRAVIVTPLLFPLLFTPLPAQSVISVRSGLINYSDGAVVVDNQPVVNRYGRYASLKDGSELLTQDGRAELLLTPNAYLRLGENSGVRLVSGNLSDTQVELLNGSAILDSGNATAGDPLTLIVGDAHIRVAEPSRLRIDAEPPQIKVFKGKAEVQDSHSQISVLADQIFPLDGSSVVQKMTDGSDDLLDIWSQQRNRLIYFNLASAQNIVDPQDNPGSNDPDAAYSAGAYGAGYSAGLNGWPGYMPMATVPPLTANLYLNPYVGAYYGGYPYGMYGSVMPLLVYRTVGYGRAGYVSGYRFAPVYPGSVGIYRGISSRPLTPGYLSTPRPATPRPVMPRVGIGAHR